MARLSGPRPSLIADPRLDELDGEVRQFIEDRTEENTPEIPAERLNEVLRGVLNDETPEGTEIREVYRVCWLDARSALMECEKLRRDAKRTV
ncbi:hypothetical protein V1525DRAFT_391685, partial [Lipomyces kononenkoae]